MPISNKTFPIIIAIAAFLFLAEISFAQRTPRPGGAAAGRRPPAAEGGATPTEPEALTAEQSIALSKSPDLNLLTPPRTLEFATVRELPGTGPVVPAKVVRFAAWSIEKHDKNSDGVLSLDEWQSMPGSPQVIDVDGDMTITLDELIRHIARFGDKRTLRSPEGPRIVRSPQIATEQVNLFRPVSIPVVPKKVDSASESSPEGAEAGTSSDPAEKPEQSGDVSEEMLKDQESLEPLEDEDVTIELVFGSGTKSADRKYYRPLEDMKGVPGWFIARDKNGDGQLSLLEFAPNLTPDGLVLFGRLDKNKDEFITPDEVAEK